MTVHWVARALERVSHEPSEPICKFCICYVCDHDDTYTKPEHRAHRHLGVADELVILHFPEAHTHNNFTSFSHLSQGVDACLLTSVFDSFRDLWRFSGALDFSTRAKRKLIYSDLVLARWSLGASSDDFMIRAVWVFTMLSVSMYFLTATIWSSTHFLAFSRTVFRMHVLLTSFLVLCHRCST